MKCNKIVVTLAFFAIALGCPNYSVAASKPVRGKNAAPAVRSNRQASDRGTEQYIVKHMKEIRLPVISFKPPATIVDAVEFFRFAAKDYDSADIPIEERGFNFTLKIAAGGAGVPVVPPIFASDIAFDEALSLVCESVGYRFAVQGGVVVVSSAAFGEMERRSYSIKPAFAKILDSLCAREKGGNRLENAFSALGGVEWPEGASVVYTRSSGKLRVCNAYKNIARLEQVLSAFNATVGPLTSPNMRSVNAAAEQAVVKRMKEMRLPAVSFKPPATIVDAVEFFRTASRDYDRPDIPIAKRGFNFALKTPANNCDWPVIPAISARNIAFDEALKLVCESVGCKFSVRGNIVFVDLSDSDEIEFRTYSMRSATVKSMAKDFKRGSAKRGAGKDASNDWKEFLLNLGVKWPEGSRIFYIESAGTLFVGNTCENISILEEVLKELKAIQK